uniref:Uncharacterized protein n=1 Tax=viral metagenome TaxID=1070528 RepID=A0A6C0E6H5_9ZZZZ
MNDLSRAGSKISVRVNQLNENSVCPNTTTYGKFLPHMNKSNMSNAMRRSQILANTRVTTMRFGVSYLGQKIEQPIVAPINRMDH